MSKKVINQKVHSVLTKTDKEAIFWVGFGLIVYFGFITICYVGSLYHV